MAVISRLEIDLTSVMLNRKLGCGSPHGQTPITLSVAIIAPALTISAFFYNIFRVGSGLFLVLAIHDGAEISARFSRQPPRFRPFL